MTRNEFAQIRAGDVLLDGDGKVPRYVWAASSYKNQGTAYIDLAIRRRSWTGKCYTCIDAGCHKRFSIAKGWTRQQKHALSKREISMLEDAGFPVRKQMRAQKKELRRLKRVGSDYPSRLTVAEPLLRSPCFR